MNKKGCTGLFYPKNKVKLVSTKIPLKYKSTWELYFMNFLDQNDSFVKWGYECFKIPYYNPVKRKTMYYYPDFFVCYRDKNNNLNFEMIEIKPLSESILESAKTTNQKIQAVINKQKWDSAKAWCEKRNIKFRVLTEKDMFI